MRSIIVLASFVLLLSACSESSKSPSTPSTSSPGSSASSSSTPPDNDFASTNRQSVAQTGDSRPGDPTQGEALFKQPQIAGTPGCAVCHSLEPGVRMVGPSMADAATVATGAVEGMSAEDFLRQSIVEPDAHIREGYTSGLMFQDYGDALSEQQISDLVAFLMTKK